MSKNNFSDGCLIFLLVIGALSFVLQAIGMAMKALIIVLLSMLALVVTYKIIRAIYHSVNPEAKKAYLEKVEKDAEENRKKIACEQVQKIAKQNRELEEWNRIERERQLHRDGDYQTSSYTYQIGKHGNESLAIRYGIANQERKVKEYWYHAKGGERKRNPDRDSVYYEPAKTIRLQKTQKLEKDLYEVLLTDYRNRKAKAVIEVGTEYVKTFYPSEEIWFEKFADLEETLKGNGTFSLKELATFHVQMTVGKL